MACGAVHHILIAAEADHATEIASVLAPTFTTRMVAGTKAEVLAAVDSNRDVAACGVSTAVDGGAGIEILRAIAATYSGVPIFLVAGPSDGSEINTASSLGIPALVWPFEASSVTGLLDAHTQRARAVVERMIRASFTEIVNPSTPWSREDEVCWQTVLGAMPKDIANDRGIKDKIVYGMQDRLRQRLKIQSVSDLRDLILGRVLPDWRSKR